MTRFPPWLAMERSEIDELIRYRAALAHIDATVGRLRLAAHSSANDAGLREWCASMADDLDKALAYLGPP